MRLSFIVSSFSFINVKDNNFFFVLKNIILYSVSADSNTKRFFFSSNNSNNVLVKGIWFYFIKFLSDSLPSFFFSLFNNSFLLRTYVNVLHFQHHISSSSKSPELRPSSKSQQVTSDRRSAVFRLAVSYRSWSHARCPPKGGSLSRKPSGTGRPSAE